MFSRTRSIIRSSWAGCRVPVISKVVLDVVLVIALSTVIVPLAATEAILEYSVVLPVVVLIHWPTRDEVWVNDVAPDAYTTVVVEPVPDAVP